jgi:hypothetical protein
VIRATASAATPRPTVRDASQRRPALLSLLLMTLLTALLALVGTAAVGQPAAAVEPYGDDIWVSVDGVAFEGDGESDEVAYVVRPLGSRKDGQAYSRELSRDERNSGWAAFWEARQAYPDGYCVVWVEVEDASNWHESQGNTACNAEDPDPAPTPQKPTPKPTATKGAKPTPAATSKPEQQPAATPAPTSTSATAESATPTPTPSPTQTPSPTPSATASGTPSPSPSHTPPAGALVQQPAVRTPVDAAEQDEVISPIGWVAVLAGGVLLTAGGLLMLWRRLT